MGANSPWGETGSYLGSYSMSYVLGRAGMEKGSLNNRSTEKGN